MDPVVACLLADLGAAAERWEAVISDEMGDRFEISYGGIEASCNRDGGLESLWLSPDLIAHPYLELEERLNVVLGGLRDAVAGAADDADATSGDFV